MQYHTWEIYITAWNDLIIFQRISKCHITRKVDYYIENHVFFSFFSFSALSTWADLFFYIFPKYSYNGFLISSNGKMYYLRNSTPLPLVPYICVGERGQHWFRWRLVAWVAPSHYLNQCWHIVNWTPRNIFQRNFEIQIFSFKKMRLNMSLAKWRPFCPGGGMS